MEKWFFQMTDLIPSLIEAQIEFNEMYISLHQKTRTTM